MPDSRKTTEDLLAGFDRTGRTPRAPPVRPPDLRRDVATVSVRPPSNRVYWPWFALGAVFAITVGVVVLLALPEKKTVSNPAPSASAPPPIAITVDTAPAISSEVAVPVAPPPPAHSAAPPASSKPRDDQRVDFVRNL